MLQSKHKATVYQAHPDRGHFSLDDWMVALHRAGVELRRNGGEWCGPCPLCGGVDRFHIREAADGRALIGCRGCIDGQPASLKKRRYGEILRSVGLIDEEKRRSQPLKPPPQPPPTPQQRKRRQQEAARARRNLAAGRRLWSEAEAIPTPPSTDAADRSPPRLWLAARHLLHPWQTPPPAIRYHTRERLIVAALWPLAALRATWPQLPEGEPPAVALCAIDDQGRKRPCQRWQGDDKKTLGRPAESGCVLALGDPNGQTPVHVAEGVADALAVYARQPGLVLSSITRIHAIRTRPGVLRRMAGCRVHLWPDHDANGEGQASGARLAEQLQAWGIPHTIHDLSPHNDPADFAAAHPFISLYPSEFAECAGRFQDAGQPLAEADRLALHQLTRR